MILFFDTETTGLFSDRLPIDHPDQPYIVQLAAQLCHDDGRPVAGFSLIVDPGIGFGKTSQHNLEILARLAELQSLGRPVCLGVSRKGFLGHMLERPLLNRLAGSLAAVCHALGNRAVQIVRVHDVAETRDAITYYHTIQGLPVG